MQAKLKADYRQETITACAGLHFDKTTWRNVPADQETDAVNNPFLELRDTPEPEPEPEQSSNSEGQDGGSEVAHTSAELTGAEQAALTAPTADGVPNVVGDALGEKMPAEPQAVDLTDAERAALPALVPDAPADAPAALATAEPEAVESDEVLEAEAEADEKAADEAEATAATERKAASTKRAARKSTR